MKFSPPLPKGERIDITTPLVGTKSTTGEAAKADWPRRLGPNRNLTSPLKGIRRSWEGGLKKIWEVKGLSPGEYRLTAFRDLNRDKTYTPETEPIARLERLTVRPGRTTDAGALTLRRDSKGAK